MIEIMMDGVELIVQSLVVEHQVDGGTITVSHQPQLQLWRTTRVYDTW